MGSVGSAWSRGSLLPVCFLSLDSARTVEALATNAVTLAPTFSALEIASLNASMLVSGTVAVLTSW
ncbi:Uncharacterised protein [Mycobacteroides abscessus subsp. abscessus]|nr:Uncharacterised protein [Mycobacteroides abscessus]SLJ82137.1 Uncharacterised protein [Mycobacteroides abscessus subsp. abscessus]